MNETTQAQNLLELMKEEIIKQTEILKKMHDDSTLLAMASAVDKCAISKMEAQIWIMECLLKNSLNEKS